MEKLYIIKKDLSQFKGSVINTMPFVEKGSRRGADILKTAYVDYTNGVTFEKYNEQHGGDLVALTWDEFEAGYYSPFMRSLQEDFAPTTLERFENALECLPPKRWTRKDGNEFFFLGECYTGNLYSCYVRIKDNYFTALRSITTPEQNIFNLNTVRP